MFAPTTVIHIDALAREIRFATYTGETTELQALVGGYIEVAAQWPDGDVLYVDEDGMSKPQTAFFRIPERPDQLLVGNGGIVGRELEDEDGEWIGNATPSLTLEEVRAKVQFLSREQFDSWGKANASDVATTVTTVGKDGTVETTVLGRVGQMVAGVPKVKP